MSKKAVISGKLAEELALCYLQNNGLKLIQQNFHSRFGEIDLIMLDKDDLVFVEVKKRSLSINNALESITRSKQQKLIRTAEYYWLKLNRDVPCRFDAVVIDGNNNCQWLKNIITS